MKKSNLIPLYKVAAGTVAITIDDGPTKYTKELLKVLRDDDQTKVTFFSWDKMQSHILTRLPKRFTTVMKLGTIRIPTQK